MRIEDIKPISLSDELIEATEDTRTFVREGAVQQLEKLLKGKNLGLARSAREALERMEKEDDSRRVSQAATQVLEPIRQAEKVEEERKAREEAERIAAQKAEEERIALEKAEAERKAKQEAERLLAEQKAEEERKAREESERLGVLKAEEERLTREKAEEKEQPRIVHENEEKEKPELEKVQLVDEKQEHRFSFAKKTLWTPMSIGAVVLVFLCFCAGFYWWIDTNFLWCVFFPFLSGC